MKIRDRIKELRRVPAGDLLPHPKNWRKHPQAQHDAMRGVLAAVGYADAVLARETPEGLQLVDGHLRAEVTPDAEIPVLVLDVTEAEAELILATHDPLAGMAEANQQALGELLADVKADGAVEAMLKELAAENDIDIFASGAEEEPPDAQIDRADELQKKWKVKPGQLWSIEGEQGHRLLCGDSTKGEDVALLLGGVSPAMMVTDPPYGVNYDANWRNEVDRANGLPYGASAVGKVTNDDRADWRDAYMLFTGAVAYVWHPAGAIQGVFIESLEAAGFDIRMTVIWAKNQFPIGRGHYHVKHEPCFYGVRRGQKGNWAGDRKQTTLWEIDKPRKSETGHSTQKPVECMARPIRNHEAADVYDPFLGSGTTMVAAEQLNRRCFGIEIEPKYCSVILQRMTDMGCKCKVKK